VQGRTAPAQTWHSFQEKFNNAQVENQKLNAVLRPVAPVIARNWRNPAGRRLQEGKPVQASVGSGAAVVASCCWQTGSKRDQNIFCPKGHMPLGARVAPPLPKIRVRTTAGNSGVRSG